MKEHSTRRSRGRSGYPITGEGRSHQTTKSVTAPTKKPKLHTKNRSWWDKSSNFQNKKATVRSDFQIVRAQKKHQGKKRSDKIPYLVDVMGSKEMKPSLKVAQEEGVLGGTKEREEGFKSEAELKECKEGQLPHATSRQDIAIEVEAAEHPKQNSLLNNGQQMTESGYKTPGVVRVFNWAGITFIGLTILTGPLRNFTRPFSSVGASHGNPHSTLTTRLPFKVPTPSNTNPHSPCDVYPSPPHIRPDGSVNKKSFPSPNRPDSKHVDSSDNAQAEHLPDSRRAAPDAIEDITSSTSTTTTAEPEASSAMSSASEEKFH